MSVSQQAPPKVTFEHGEIKTTMDIDGRKVHLVAGKDGLVRQIKGETADPRIDPDVAARLSTIRGWRVGSWPVGYEPREEIIRVPGGVPQPAPEANGEQAAREGMLSQMRFIGRPRRARHLQPEAQAQADAARAREALPPAQTAEEFEERRRTQYRAADAPAPEPDLGDAERISELMAEVTALMGTVAASEARVAELERDNAALRRRLDQQGRIVVPATPPKDGSDGVDRAAPTAEDMDKGKNLNPGTSARARRAAKSRGTTETDAVPAIAGATAGIQRG